MIAAVMLPGQVFAYPGGLLQGKAAWYSVDGKNYNKITDGNALTTEIIAKGTSNYYRWYLGGTYKITKLQWKWVGYSDAGWIIRGYNSAGTQVGSYTVNLGSANLERSQDVNWNNVTQIRIYNASSRYDVSIAEFDIFGTAGTPSVPSGLKATATKGQVVLTWNAATGATGYYVYRNGSKITSTPITGTTYTATGLADNTTYTWQVTAYNGVVESAKSASVTSYYDAKPAVPLLKSVVPGPGQAVLSWDAADNASGYNVYRDGTKITSTPITGTTYTATGLADNTTYTWQVTAINGPLESAKSNIIKSNWDTIPPGKPAGLTATPKPNAILLEWFANKGDGTAGYYLYRDNVRINSVPVTSTSYTVNAIPGINHTFEVSAVDDAQNESVKSDPIQAEALPPLDQILPAQPIGLTATGQIGSVKLTWTANTESDLSGYYVYRNGVKLNQEPITDTVYIVSGGMNFGIGYSFAVSAVDKAGNESKKSNPVTAAPLKPNDITPPATPQGLTGSISTDALKILLSWNANTESDLAGYNLFVSNDGITYQKINAQPITGTDYEYNNIEGNTHYYFRLSAVDESGNESKQSTQLSIKTPSRETSPILDPTPPKLIITWAPVHGAVQYLIYYQDQLYAIVPGNATSYEITLDDGYDPEAERQKVIVKAKFVDGSTGQDPSGSDRAARKWGFSPGDIFTNSVFLIGTLAGFILFSIVFRLLPFFIHILKNAFRRRRAGL